ncbi:MAG: hypothetical protein ACREE6_11995 [Limisphaerales bacterium]
MLQRSNVLTFQRLIAFTLIELLVVIAIIVAIAALLLPVGAAMVRKSIIQRAMSERDQLETAIQAYHAKYGFYPPANATGNGLTNQLYYELLGTTASVGAAGTNFTTLDNASQISAVAVAGTFGVSGFMNCTKASGSVEDSIPAQTFLAGLKSGEIASNGVFTFIATAANSDPGFTPMPGVYSLAGRAANPWRYVCPGTNNPASYDLWVQVFVGNKTNLICNWSKNPEINVPMP